MNARQAAKAAAKRIEELEDFNRRAVLDIKAYNACIDGVIAGACSYCDWCQEYEECDRPEKGIGCEMWWLKYNLEQIELKGDDGADDNDTQGISGASGQC